MKTKIVNFDYEKHVMQFEDTGWFNATVASSYFNKEPTSWLRQRETLDYLVALAKRHGKCGFVTELNKIKDVEGTSSSSRTKLLRLAKQIGFIRVKSGNPETGGGTWMHPKLAVAFARWLDVDFSVWCDEQIDGLLRGNIKTNDDWKRVRHEASASHKVMSSMLNICRFEQGKDTCSYHYMNESKLVNWVYTGAFKGLDRELLDFDSLDVIAKIETRNAMLIGRGMDYHDRKPELLRFANQLKEKQKKLCA